MQREPLLVENFYHIYNRGVDKRTIFEEPADYLRFLFALYLFNDSESLELSLSKINPHELLLQREASNEQQRLVDIAHWSCMPNHFHLLLRQREDGGISRFMQKVGTGYTMYFNVKNERVGSLFQGTFKSKLVKKDEYFACLASYIPLNPLEFYFPSWKAQGIPPAELKKVKQALKDYRWTSFRDYFGKPIIPDLVCKKSFLTVFGGTTRDYEEYLNDLLQSPRLNLPRG